MRLIIDANNLAGKLGLLGTSNFDQTLLTLVRASNRGKGREVWLVFDGGDPHGDRYIAGDNVTVVRAPRGTSADDRIVELAAYLGDLAKRGEYRDELTVVSDDSALIEQTKALTQLFAPGKLLFESATAFAARLSAHPSVPKPQDPGSEKREREGDERDDRGLGRSEIDRINDDLKRFWS